MHIFKNRITDILQKRARKKRFIFFKYLIDTLPKPVSILDVGGTLTFWENMGFAGARDVNITLVNLEKSEPKYPNFKNFIGDARDLKMFKKNEFDVVFSNSVIEHVGDFENQMQMAKEIRRLARRYFVQTPNYWFPIEPHYRSLYFQLYPLCLKVFRLRFFGVGRLRKIPDKSQAYQEAKRIRLLKVKHLKTLFPDAKIYKENFMGLTKSIIALKF